ncbi:ABC transporter permease [Deltaproteobacteria bacterium]|nr:ABC transporter permease [Deltaproteobacteria bacterium]
MNHVSPQSAPWSAQTPPEVAAPLNHARCPWFVKACIIFLACVALAAVFADVLAPRHYTAQDLSLRLKAPFWAGGPAGYALGTDHLGRDVFSRLLYATRISLVVALAGTCIAASLGTILGLLAAKLRGVAEEAVMLAVDFQAAMPFILIALAMLAFFGNSFSLFLLLMGIHGWEKYTRLARGTALSIQTRGYIRAAQAVGASPLRIYGRHVMPNIAGTLIVQSSLNFPETVLLETSLSFLGLGIQPPLTSLGSMLGEGRDYLLSHAHIAVAPGIIIFCVTISACIIGDWLRDVLDPTLR